MYISIFLVATISSAGLEKRWTRPSRFTAAERRGIRKKRLVQPGSGRPRVQTGRVITKAFERRTAPTPPVCSGPTEGYTSPPPPQARPPRPRKGLPRGQPGLRKGTASKTRETCQPRPKRPLLTWTPGPWRPCPQKRNSRLLVPHGRHSHSPRKQAKRKRINEQKRKERPPPPLPPQASPRRPLVLGGAGCAGYRGGSPSIATKRPTCGPWRTGSFFYSMVSFPGLEPSCSGRAALVREADAREPQEPGPGIMARAAIFSGRPNRHSLNRRHAPTENHVMTGDADLEVSSRGAHGCILERDPGLDQRNIKFRIYRLL